VYFTCCGGWPDGRKAKSTCLTEGMSTTVRGKFSPFWCKILVVMYEILFTLLEIIVDLKLEFRSIIRAHQLRKDARIILNSGTWDLCLDMCLARVYVHMDK